MKQSLSNKPNTPSSSNGPPGELPSGRLWFVWYAREVCRARESTWREWIQNGLETHGYGRYSVIHTDDLIYFLVNVRPSSDYKKRKRRVPKRRVPNRIRKTKASTNSFILPPPLADVPLPRKPLPGEPGCEYHPDTLKVRQAFLESGLSTRKLAARLGCHYQAVSQAMTNIREMRPETVEKYMRAIQAKE